MSYEAIKVLLLREYRSLRILLPTSQSQQHDSVHPPKPPVSHAFAHKRISVRAPAAAARQPDPQAPAWRTLIHSNGETHVYSRGHSSSHLTPSEQEGKSQIVTESRRPVPRAALRSLRFYPKCRPVVSTLSAKGKVVI